jgi:hypothetical protein
MLAIVVDRSQLLLKISEFGITKQDVNGNTDWYDGEGTITYHENEAVL